MSDHLLHLAARTIGAMPLRPRVRLRFEPAVDDARGVPSLEPSESEHITGAADRDPASPHVVDERASRARTEEEVEAQRPSRRAIPNPSAPAGLLERPLIESVARWPEQPDETIRENGIEPESQHGAATGASQRSTPRIGPGSERCPETGSTVPATRDARTVDHGAAERPIEDLAARPRTIVRHGARIAVAARDGEANAVSGEPAPVPASPKAEQRHRFDAHRPRVEPADTVAVREQRTRPDTRGRHGERHLQPDRGARIVEPVVHVSIGRIEVRANAPAVAPRAADRGHSPMTIEDYVARGKAR